MGVHYAMSESASLRKVQIRKLIAEWWLGVVALLVVLALLGGWVAYGTHVDPGTVAEEETVATWEEETEVSHQAAVERSNPVFDPNETLSEQPHYFTQVSPTLEGAYTYRYEASDAGDLDAELTATLQIRAVDGEGNAYWQRTEVLNRTDVPTLEPGESATVPFAFNVSEAVQEAERIESTLEATVGTPEVAVAIDTYLRGTVNGERVTQLHQEDVLVRPDGGIYHVETDEPVQQTHEQTRTAERTASYGPLRSYGSVALVLLAVGGLVGVLALRHRETLAPTEAALTALEQHQQRAEFEEWISRGRVPPEAVAGPGIELDSLADLVDVAIDTNNRVIEDARTGVFVVLGDDWYYVTPPQQDRSDSQQLLRFERESARPDSAGADGGSGTTSERRDSAANGSAASDGEADSVGHEQEVSPGATPGASDGS